MCAPASGVPPRPQRRPIGDAIKPTGYLGAFLNGCRLAHEHQKGRLEHVFGVVRIQKQVAADTQDHGPMALHQRREGRFVMVGHEPLQQVRV